MPMLRQVQLGQVLRHRPQKTTAIHPKVNRFAFLGL